MLHDALMGGLWASIGSTLGKLSGVSSVTGDSYIVWFSLLAIMVMANTWGCRYYLRALDAGLNSVSPTVISAASSYILSGLIGVIIFDEGASIRWWIGAALIIAGLALVAQPRNSHKKSM